MKEIFDWLREQINDAHRNFRIGGSRFMYVVDAVDIINEAEAKWEADCCEPIPLDKEKYSSFFNESFVFMGCSEGDEPRSFDRQAVLDMVYCPYCGKRISVKEV